MVDCWAPDKCVLLNNLNFQRAAQVHQGCRPSEQVKVSFESSPCERSMNSEFITVISLWFELKTECCILSVQDELLVNVCSTNTKLPCNKVKHHNASPLQRNNIKHLFRCEYLEFTNTFRHLLICENINFTCCKVKQIVPITSVKTRG